MLEMIVRIVFVAFFAIYNFMFMKKVLNSDEEYFKLKNIFLSLLLTIIYGGFYTISYNISMIFIKYSLGFLINIFMFQKSFYKTLIAYIIEIIIVLIADLLNTTVYMQFITIEQLRNVWYYMFLSNITVIVTMLLSLKIKPIINKLTSFIQNIEIDKNYDRLSFFILIEIALINIGYNIASIYQLNTSYIINLVITILVLIIAIIYVHNSLNYSNLLKEYDALFLYIQEFEDMIDNINIVNHEIKNQLVVLKSYIELGKKKDALNIIDDITLNAYQTDERVLVELKHLPKGGLKGLIYYKVLKAKNKKLKIEIDVSKNVHKKLSNLSIEQNKTLCRIIGVYLDNAIDAASETKNKIISIEVYSLDENSVNIVISNTFNNKALDINKIGKRGYTTKGKGHGRGTYLVKKLISKNEWIEESKNISNNLYIEKVIITTKKK